MTAHPGESWRILQNNSSWSMLHIELPMWGASLSEVNAWKLKSTRETSDLKYFVFSEYTILLHMSVLLAQYSHRPIYILYYFFWQMTALSFRGIWAISGIFQGLCFTFIHLINISSNFGKNVCICVCKCPVKDLKGNSSYYSQQLLLSKGIGLVSEWKGEFYFLLYKL